MTRHARGPRWAELVNMSKHKEDNCTAKTNRRLNAAAHAEIQISSEPRVSPRRSEPYLMTLIVGAGLVSTSIMLVSLERSSALIWSSESGATVAASAWLFQAWKLRSH